MPHCHIPTAVSAGTAATSSDREILLRRCLGCRRSCRSQPHNPASQAGHHTATLSCYCCLLRLSVSVATVTEACQTPNSWYQRSQEAAIYLRASSFLPTQGKMHVVVFRLWLAHPLSSWVSGYFE